MTIWVDADACPVVVREILFKAAVRTRVTLTLIAESDGIGRVAFNAESGELSGDYVRILEGLGDKGTHWTKTLNAGPDGWLYLNSGSTCNVCEEDDPQRATIMRFKPDGSELSVYATGLRNSVGMDWAPWS